MIVVKIEMWPKGDASRARDLGRMFIYNAGGTDERGDYEVRVCRKGNFNPGVAAIQTGDGFTRTGRVENYPRLAYNIWRLVLRGLRSAFPEEG
jgi:hypothetical protein